MNRQAVLHTAAYLVLFVCFTFIFMLFGYPSERLTDQVNGWTSSVTGGALTVDKVHIRPPLSLLMDNIMVRTDQEAPLDIGRAVVKPRLLGLLSGKKSAGVRLENPWLDSDLDIAGSDKGWRLDIRSMDVDLSQLPADLMTLPLRLKGKVEMSMNLFSSAPSPGVLNGDARIDSGPVEIGGDIPEALGFAPLNITRIMAVATIKDNVLTLGENTVEGDLMATARGSIRIASPGYMDSRLDLTVELRPAPQSRERLAPVLTLLGARPRADGSINVRIQGTVERPSIAM